MIQMWKDTQEAKVHYLQHHSGMRQDRETTVVYDVSANAKVHPPLTTRFAQWV